MMEGGDKAHSEATRGEAAVPRTSGKNGCRQDNSGAPLRRAA